MNYELRIKKLKNTGYTIIETMIAVSLFLIIVMIGMGALLNANLLHQKSRDMRSIMDNLSFIMEDMSNNLRTGHNFHCIDTYNFNNISAPQDGNNCLGIAFTNQDGKQWVYYVGLNGTRSNTISKAVDVPLNFTPLNPEEVIVDPASGFSVSGAPAGDSTQPFVTVKLIGEIILKDNIKTPFSLQTSISQRGIDI